jgi:hypothetical protein
VELAVSGGDEGQADTEIMAQLSDGFQAHVADSLNCPFVALFKQQSANQADNGSVVS